MPTDPYAVLRALLRAEARRTTAPRPEPKDQPQPTPGDPNR
ncbi:hypothetical protein [Streptomyces alanosinicus]|uniref:Uncharacterized protein n=1 Tax=Streptomyces alanosinicus TaxID=68171 RepID=A0A919D273_9ACTN|nr:hypothetical protein [Streptomyces alanosinicus]GHE03584.1 hypothetical protein GCM10010339_31490 [Streptomyces alanosinicus]